MLELLCFLHSEFVELGECLLVDLHLLVDLLEETLCDLQVLGRLVELPLVVHYEHDRLRDLLLVEVDVLRAFILELLVLVLVRFLLRVHCVPHLVQHNHQIIHSLRRLQLNVHRVQQRLSKARPVDLLKVNQKLLTSERSELKTKPSDNNNKIYFILFRFYFFSLNYFYFFK